jgi:hypothetical protein
MQVSSIEKYPRYIVEIEHEEVTYTVHISEDMIQDEHYILNIDTGDDLPQSDPLYQTLLDAAWYAIETEDDGDETTILSAILVPTREDLLKIASIANPNVMSTPEMLFERLSKIDALVKDILQKTA